MANESDRDEIDHMAKTNAAEVYDPMATPVVTQASTLSESQPRITIVNEIPSQPLWATPLLLFLGAVLAVGSSAVTNWIARSREQRSNRDLLLLAFLAEAQVNARTLKNAVRVTAHALDSGRLPHPLVDRLRPKTAVFDVNLNRLGEFRDPKLTEQVAMTYAHYDNAEASAETWRERPEGDVKTDDLRLYWRTIAGAGYGTALLVGMFEVRTAHVKTPRELEEGLIPEPVQKELLIFTQLRDRIGSVEGDRGTE